MIPGVLVSTFFNKGNRLTVHVANRTIFTGTNRHGSKYSKTFTLPNGLRRLHHFTKVKGSRNGIPLKRATNLVPLMIRVIRGSRPLTSLRRLFSRKFNLVSNHPNKGGISFLIVFRRRRHFIRIFMPRGLRDILSNFFMRLTSILHRPRKTIIFDGKGVRVRLTLLLIRVFRFARGVLLRIVGTNGARLFTGTRSNQQENMNRFYRATNKVFNGFRPVHRGVNNRHFFPFQGFFLGHGFIRSRRYSSPFHFFYGRVVSYDV